MKYVLRWRLPNGKIDQRVGQTHLKSFDLASGEPFWASKSEALVMDDRHVARTLLDMWQNRRARTDGPVVFRRKSKR